MLTELARPPRSRAQRKADTRQALLDAAVAVIAERGLDGTTARAISDRAGVAAGTFFVHFAEVPALLDELLDQQLRRSLERVHRALPADVAVVDALVHVADALLAGYRRDPDLSRAFLAATLFRTTAAGPSAERLAELRAWVVARLAAAQEAAEIGADVDVEVVFESFFCLYLGLVVGGLRGELARRRQRELLRTTLVALLGVRS